VNTTFEDAADVFAPQKGATPEAVIRLAARLRQIAVDLPRDPRGVPMGGCAGGLSGGLWAAFDAELRAGAAFVLQLLDFGRRLRGVDAVITGEGCLDPQSFDGKIVGQIATACAAQGRDLHIVAGRDALGRRPVDDLPIRSIREAGTIRALREAGVQIGQEIRGGWT
jgi:glycerate kinase